MFVDLYGTAPWVPPENCSNVANQLVKMEAFHFTLQLSFP